ncbi:MAG: hypothetical protein R3F49_06720 [Planctomycetota bacterium]
MRLATKGRQSKQGTALVASLLVVATIAGLGAYLVQVQAAFAKRQGVAIDRKRALYVAEAGLAEGVLSISQGKSGALGTEELPVRFHDGVYWVESEGLNDGRRVLTSRALVGTGQFTVRMVVLPNVHQVGALGFFGLEGVTIGDGVVIDGYDARVGNYDAGRDPAYAFRTTGGGGLVRSNGDIFVDDAAAWPADTPDPFGVAHAALPASVRADYDGIDDAYLRLRLRQSQSNLAPRTSFLLGEVMPGPEGTLITTGSTAIEAVNRAETLALLPPVITPETSRTVRGRTTVSRDRQFGDTSIHYDEFEVVAGAELKIAGPAVIHTRRLRVASGGRLTLNDSAGPILIVVEDDLDFEYGSIVSSWDEDQFRCGTFIFVTPSADPTDDNRVCVDCIGDFRGILYAPGDRVTLPTMLRVWGAVAAKHLTIADGAWLTYDGAFRVGGEGVPAFPQQQSWHIVEEEAVARRIGFDPLRDLAARGIEPLTPAVASPEQSVTVRYFDAGGTRRQYSGAAAALDFSTLERVIGVQWQNPVTGTYSELLRPSGVDPDNLIESMREVRRHSRRY